MPDLASRRRAPPGLAQICRVELGVYLRRALVVTHQAGHFPARRSALAQFGRNGAATLFENLVGCARDFSNFRHVVLIATGLPCEWTNRHSSSIVRKYADSVSVSGTNSRYFLVCALWSGSIGSAWPTSRSGQAAGRAPLAPNAYCRPTVASLTSETSQNSIQSKQACSPCPHGGSCRRVAVLPRQCRRLMS